MKRTAILAYGALGYMAFLLAMIFFVEFLSNAVMARTVDAPASSDPLLAFFIDVGLIGLFGVQHSVMARASVKARFTGLLEGPHGRSTYVLAASFALGVLILFWQPISFVIWSFDDSFVRGMVIVVAATGWLLIAYATLLVDPWGLLGLRQVVDSFCGLEFKEVPLMEVGIYRYIRHPTMVGLIIALWAAPTMTLGHLLLSVGLSLYIWIGVTHEERDLVRLHGVAYTKYQAKVGRFFPRRRSFGWEWEEL